MQKAINAWLPRRLLCVRARVFGEGFIIWRYRVQPAILTARTGKGALQRALPLPRPVCRPNQNSMCWQSRAPPRCHSAKMQASRPMSAAPCIAVPKKPHFLRPPPRLEGALPLYAGSSTKLLKPLQRPFFRTAITLWQQRGYKMLFFENSGFDT